MSFRSGDDKRRTNTVLMQHLILKGREGVGSARRGRERGQVNGNRCDLEEDMGASQA